MAVVGETVLGRCCRKGKEVGNGLGKVLGVALGLLSRYFREVSGRCLEEKRLEATYQNKY